MASYILISLLLVSINIISINTYHHSQEFHSLKVKPKGIRLSKRIYYEKSNKLTNKLYKKIPVQ